MRVRAAPVFAGKVSGAQSCSGIANRQDEWVNRIVRAGFGLLLIATTGCRSLDDRDADFSRILNEPAPVSDSVRASFGTMGVVTTAARPQLLLESPRNFGDVFGGTAARSFAAMEKISFEESDNPADDARALMFVAAGAVAAGLVVGAFNSIPQSEVEKGQAAMSLALRDEPLDRGIQRELLKQAQGREIASFRPVPELLVDQIRVSNPTNLDLRALSGQDVDSVLVLNVERCGFASRFQGNPPLAFVALINADVVQARDGTMLHSGTVIYTSGRRHFNRWVANDAQLFRSELEKAQRLCAEVLLDQFYGNPSGSRTSQ